MRLLLFNLATDADDSVLGFTTRWIHALSKQAASIDVITMRAGRLDVPDNVRVFSVGKEKGYSEPRRAVEFYRILFRLLRAQRYDGCFAHMMPVFALMGAPLLRLKKIPLLLWYTHKSVTLLLRAATFWADGVVTASEESFQLPSNKLKVIGHGVEAERFVPGITEKRPFTILSISRLSPIKRIELLIEACALLRRQEPDFLFHVKIVGGPLLEKEREYAARLAKNVERLRLQDFVSFEGSVEFSNVVSYYQQADCFVNLCPTGGMDKAVLEAMSCAVPAIVINETFRRVLGTEASRKLVIEAESQQLADRLLMLGKMPIEERSRLGRRLREIVLRDYTLEGVVQRILQEFQP